MASQTNPFSALHQKDGAVSSAGRGRGRGGASGRHSPHPPGNANTGVPRDPSVRGRGRGASVAARASRGGARGARGAGVAGNTWHGSKPEAQTNPIVSPSVSPFTQLKQNQRASSRGVKQTSRPTSQLQGFGKASPLPPGAPSTVDETVVDSRRDPRKRRASKQLNGVAGSNVPVEDLSAMNSYNERYEQLKLDRAKEREQAIKDGQMADPSQPMSLNKAITPVGTCTSMCPEFERVERIVQKMVDKSEKFLHPATNKLQNMEEKMLKRFRRSAAGYDEQLPSDIRTPSALLQTTNYLIRHIIGGPEPLGVIHKFVWDRTRSIRNDFSVQQLTQEEDVKIAVTCLERIARFHIVSLHLLSSPANEEPFDRHQEREQLNNTMLSLMYYYDDNRGRISFPNEDEFRAYYIIFSIHDQRPDLEARVQKWPPELRNSPRVRVALELFAAAGNTWEYQGTLDAKRPNAIAQGFYARFFSLVDSPGVSYLMACVAEIYFNHMRQTAIRSIWKGYCRYPSSQQHKNEEWTVDELTRVLYFDDREQTIEFCEAQDLEFAGNSNGDLYLNWGSRPVDSVAFQPSSDHSFSEKYVESKRAGRSMVAIVLGLNVKEAAGLGMIDSSLLSERVSPIAAPERAPVDNDDSLFVSDDENEVPMAVLESDDKAAEAAGAAAATAFGTGFGGISQPATSNVPGPFSFSQTPSESQAPASNPFASFFSPCTSTNASAAPAAPTLSPFATPFTPGSSVQAPETSRPTTSSLTPTASTEPSSVFSGASSFAQPSQNGTAPATSTTPFKFPNAPTPTSQSSPFSFSSNIQQPTISNASPSGVPQASMDAKSDQPNGLTAGQSSTSIFNTAKPSPKPFSSIFSFSGQGTKPKEASTDAQETSKQQLPAESPQVFAPTSEPKKNEASSILSTTPSIVSSTPTPAVNSNTFSPPVGEPLETSQDKSPEHQTVSFTEPEATNAVPPEGTVAPLSINGDVEQAETAALREPTTDLQPDIPEEVPSTSVETASERQASDEAERQRAWIRTLQEAAERRRRKSLLASTSRKRTHEEEEAVFTEETVEAPKPPKVQKAEKPPRKSMALSSIQPLPKLPILETVESLIARKPAEKTPEKGSKAGQIDEDDLLISAARIAAESLRNGFRLSEGAAAPQEPWRSSFSPRSSVTSSMAFSGSLSPPSSLANGSDFALGSDSDLGLRRSLSRSEQRIRRTRARGIAYKPVSLTPEKKSGNKRWPTP